MSKAIDTNDEAAVQLALITGVKKNLAAIEKDHADPVDLDTVEGLANGKAKLKVLVNARNTVENARLAHNKARRAIVKKDIDACDALAKTIQPRIEKLETPLSDAIGKIDAEKKRIEAEKAVAEQRRVDELRERINDINSAASNAITLDDVNNTIARFGNITPESFEEFEDEAVAAIALMDTALNSKKTALEAQAAEAARLEEQRLEQERQAEKLRKQQEAIDEQARQLEADKKQAADEQKAIDDEAGKESDEPLAPTYTHRSGVFVTDKSPEKQAERDRLTALAPDADKLRVWIDTIPEIPEMETDEGKAAAKQVLAYLQSMGEAISDLKMNCDNAKTEVTA